MVVGVLGALAFLIKVRYAHTSVDSYVFRLHYRWATAFCLVSCVLVMAKDHIGEAIQCLGDNKDILKQVTTYCWITSTFTINTTEGAVIKGVGPYHPKHHEQTFHAYYQWVPAVLFLQSCLFYAPHLIWKCYERKQVDLLLQDLNKGLFDEDSEKKKKNIISYLKESWGLNTHYATIYHICEALNLVNVLFQMYLMNLFFGGMFMEYGVKMLALYTEDKNDILLSTFPKLTKCLFHMTGPTGTVQDIDILCVLPQNIINEKIFLVMWLMLVLLAAVTGAWLIWRCVVMYVPSIRFRILKHLCKSNLSPKTEQTIRSLHLGDYCVLETIGYNLDTLSFKDVLQGVTDVVEEYNPSAPVDGGTYRPFYTPNDVETLPRHRHIGFADTAM